MRHHVAAFATGVAVAIAASAGVAFATGAVSVGGGTTINACANETNGLVRVVSDTGACRVSERPISWNSEGPAGPPGPAGEAKGYALVYVGELDPDRTTASVSRLTSTIVTTYNPQFNYTQKVRYACFDLTFTPKSAITGGVAFTPANSYGPIPSVVLAGMPNFPASICPDWTDALMAVASSSSSGQTVPADPPQATFFILFN